MLLPLALSGCICTTLNVDIATHDFRHDTVRRIVKAGLTSDDKLVILVDGTRAEWSRIRPYTVTVTLPGNEDFVRVPQDGMTNGWNSELFGRMDTLPITAGVAVVLPAHEAIRNQQNLLEIPKADRALYLIQHSKPDKETSLFYVENDPHPRKIDFDLDGRDVQTPERSPLLLLVPLSIAVDVVTLPYQIYVLRKWDRDRPVSVTPIKAQTPAAQGNGQ